MIPEATARDGSTAPSRPALLAADLLSPQARHLDRQLELIGKRLGTDNLAVCASALVEAYSSAVAGARRHHEA